MQLSLTTIIIIITVLVSYISFSNRELLFKLLLWPYRMKREPVEYYRILTSGFVHNDTTHLIVNMLTFYFFADALLGVVGNVHFLILYCSAIIVANLPSVVKNKDKYESMALGASGGVAAIVFAYIYLSPWNLLYLFFIVPIPAILFAIIYVVYSYKMKDKDSKIGHEAHLWGAVYGFLYMALVIDPVPGRFFMESIKAIPYF
jgi:membrane associated rhomboid family serine protease